MVHKKYSIRLATVMDEDDDITVLSWPRSARGSGVLARIPASTPSARWEGRARRPGAHTPSPGLLHRVLFHADSVSVVLEDVFKMMRAYF